MSRDPIGNAIPGYERFWVWEIAVYIYIFIHTQRAIPMTRARACFLIKSSAVPVFFRTEDLCYRNLCQDS